MRRYLVLSILFLTACLPASTPSSTPRPSIDTPSLNPTVSPFSAQTGQRVDPVLYTYWISGPEILELASEVHLKDLATGTENLLFKAPEASAYMRIRNVASSAFSPGGRDVLISFTDYGDSGGSLRLIAVDGSSITPLFAVHSSALEYAIWSPDGKQIAMRRGLPDGCLVIGNPADGKISELGPCDPLEYPRFWSRDGKWIAVYRFAGANTTEGDWLAVAADGGKRVPLRQLPALEWYDERSSPWRVTREFACTWPTDPRAAKHFSFWRCQ